MLINLKKFMKIFSKVSLFLVFASFLAYGAGPVTALAAGPAPVNLLSATNFAILSKTGITNTGSHTSVITGNIGASPITSAAMDNVFCPEITGTIYGVDAAYTGNGTTTCFAGNPPLSNKTLVDNAVLDMGTAYTDAAGRTLPDGVNLFGGNLGGQTFAPGLYKWSTDVTIPTNVTLSGSASDVWIFQISGNLSVASAGSVPAGVKVVLSGGAQASNVFWQVGGGTGATLGTYSTFNGTILSAKQIIIQTGAVLNGRALAHTAVTLDASTVTKPTSVINPPPHNKKALLVVKKHVVGGSANAGQFMLTVKNGGLANPVTFWGSETGKDVKGFTAGKDYKVLEHNVGPTGYTVSFSEGCKGYFTESEIWHNAIKTCVVTNTWNGLEEQGIQQQGGHVAHLNVIKHVVGGNVLADQFSLMVAGGAPSPANFNGSEAGVDVILSSTGTYQVHENTAAHPNYTVSYSPECSGVVGLYGVPGMMGVNGVTINEYHPKTCVVTNTLKVQ
jgi:hypothetical protein